MAPLRILLISPFFPPQPSVASLRAHSFARAWADGGDAVTVLTTAKRLDQTGLDLSVSGLEVIEIEGESPRLLEWARGVGRSSKEWSPTTAARRSRGVISWPRELKSRTGAFSGVRMPDMTDGWVQPAVKWCAMAERGWDVVVSCGGPYTAHLAAMAIKRRRIALHWAADFRDLWTQHPLYSGLFPWTIRERALERAVLEDADAITTVSDGLAATLRERTTRPVELVTNGYDAEALASLPEERILPRDGITRLVYTGSYYPRGQNAAPLLQAMTYLHNHRPDVARRLRLVLAGSDLSAWAHVADAHGVLPMLDFRGGVPWRDALRLQRDADALVLIDWHDPQQGVLTGKLFEYLASKPPVLVIGGAVDSPVATMVGRAGRGIILENDESAVREAIERLMNGEVVCRSGRDDEYVARFSRQNQAVRMRAVLDETMSRSV